MPEFSARPASSRWETAAEIRETQHLSNITLTHKHFTSCFESIIKFIIMSRDEMPNSPATSNPDTPPQSPGGDEDEDSKTPGTKKRNSKSSKPRLTAVQKNTNHKDAENKRRTAIRERFTELSQLVPDALGQERSEQVMLVKTRDYLQSSIAEIRQLTELAQQQGIPIPDEMRMNDFDYGGSKWKEPNMAKYEKSKTKKLAKGGSALDDLDGEAEDEI